jgi:hypothetical protein
MQDEENQTPESSDNATIAFGVMVVSGLSLAASIIWGAGAAYTGLAILGLLSGGVFFNKKQNRKAAKEREKSEG